MGPEPAAKRHVIRCDDGHLIAGDSEDELVVQAEAHFRLAHPTLAGQLSRREIFAMAIAEEQRTGDTAATR